MTNSLLTTAPSRIGYLDQTQKMLARNIANLDTPGFSPQAAIPFAKLVGRGGELPLAVTHVGDQAGHAAAGGAAQVMTVTARAPDGNAVSLNQELAAVAKTQISQQYAVNIYKTYLGMFRTALGATL